MALSCPPDEPSTEQINRAAGIIKEGGVVVYPTWCIYGLGADAMNPGAVSRIFRIKRRPASNPILVLVKDKKEVEKLAASISPVAEKIMDRFWPGSITVVFNARPDIPEILTAGTGKIGIRVPQNKTACKLVTAFDGPLTGTSANISGLPGCADLSGITQSVINEADMVLDAGKLKGGVGSTVVDVTVEPPLILREGEVSSSAFFNRLK